MGVKQRGAMMVLPGVLFDMQGNCSVLLFLAQKQRVPKQLHSYYLFGFAPTELEFRLDCWLQSFHPYGTTVHLRGIPSKISNRCSLFDIQSSQNKSL